MNKKPPLWPIRFLRWFCHPEYVDDIEGDLLERFEKNPSAWHFALEVFKLLRPGIIRKLEGTYKLNSYGMFKHHLKTGYRSLIRDKSYAAINVFGLALGMAVCLVIFQYVHFQLSYDTFHENHQNTYRAIIRETNSNTHEMYPDGIGYGFGIAAVEEIPEVTQAVRKGRINRIAAVTNPGKDRVFYEEVNDLLYVDPSFFDVFDFPLLAGHRSDVFSDAYSVVITRTVAQNYFGDSDPIGKILTISGPPSPGNFVVTGVLEDPPLNSHLQFGFLMPLTNYIENGWGGAVKKNGAWNGFEVVTYFTLERQAKPRDVEEKLTTLIAAHTQEMEIKKEVILQPIADIHLKSGEFSFPGYLHETGNIQNSYIFSIISILIVLIAWTNYINLATSQSLRRSREVGIRKTMGAYQRNLISQFILESALINLFAAVCAMGLAYLLMPVLNGFIEKELTFSLMGLPWFWMIFLGAVLSGALLAGAYPAFVLSGFRPIHALKKQVSTTGNVSFRKGLIVFQFLASLLLISATYLIYRQVTFLKDQELSTDMEKIVLLKGPRVIESNEQGVQTFDVFRDELAKHHAIEAVAGSLSVPGHYWTGGLRKNLNVPPSEAPHGRGFYVTRNFEKTYDFQFLAGGPFTKNMTDENHIILNESALSVYGFATAEAAIGQKLFDDHSDRMNTIVGVVKDFHWHSLQEDHQPYVLSLYEGRMTENISIRLSSSDLEEALDYIESSFHTFFPGNPFDYSFADEAFNHQYELEQQFGKLFFFFSGIALLIGCVGLFALVSYSINTKVKEIGIRKVLGARVGQIVLLLSKDYLRLILISFGIAVPLIWVAGKEWLHGYAHRISLGLDVFLVPAVILLLIALLTVGQRTLRSAAANPVDSLRDE